MPKDIKEGEVAYVKISHEPVFVLKVSDGIATCRRGTIGQSGSYYLTTDFTLPELMSEDPQRLNFETLFKNDDGEIRVAAPADDSFLQN